MAGILKRLAFIANSIPGDAVALTSGDYQLTYKAMLDAVNQRINWLSKFDSRVIALYADNHVEWVLYDLACQELGLVLVPIPMFFTEHQIYHCLNSSGVNLLLTDQPNLPHVLERQFDALSRYQESDATISLYAWKNIQHPVSQLPEGTQKITFTSGSTGNPKGVCLSTRHQWLVAQSLADMIAINRPKHLCLLPLSTLLENVAGVYTPLLSGGEVVIPSASGRGLTGSSELHHEAMLQCITQTQPTTMILVPQLLSLLVQAIQMRWVPPASLQFVAVGGGCVSPRLIRHARSEGLPVFQGYGLSECGSVVALNTPGGDRISKVGRVLPHCCVTIEGEEVVVSGAVHLGYLGEPDSWYSEKVHTGDLGSLDDSFLSIEGRCKNVLITSFGRNISPEWVESVLMSTPSLNNCVVLGDGRPYIIALVSANPAISDRDIGEWVQICNESLPDYAKVGSWERISDEEFEPCLTANGRPQRELLMKAFSAQIEQMY